MKRAALYIRVSHEEQALHGDSIESQKKALNEYATKHDYYIVDQYVDEGQSARKSYSKRAEFVRMMEDIKQNKIDLILFTKLDRWFRNIADYYKIQEVLDTHNTAWKTILENYDTTTASGRLYVNIMLSVAQDEADRTSERIKFVFTDKVQRGEVISGSAPIGYKIENKHLIPDDRAPIVREAYEFYSKSHSKHATVLHLQEKFGLRTAYITISRMLSNPLYKGEKGSNPHFCEPIVSIELWDRVQVYAKANVKKPKTGRVYLFSGMMNCPECGRRLTGVQIKATKGYVGSYHNYRCPRHAQSNTCSFAKHLSELKIEQYLIEHIRIAIDDYRISYERATHEIAQRPTVDKAKVKRRMDKLKELYLEDLIDKDTYKRDYEECSKQLENAKKIKPPAAFPKERFLPILRENFVETYNTMKPEDRRQLWLSIIKKIHVDTDKNLRIEL